MKVRIVRVWILMVTLVLSVSFEGVVQAQTVTSEPETIALWLFDEPTGLYPSHVIDDHSSNDYPLTLGLCGKISEGKYGHSLETQDRPDVNFEQGDRRFGLAEMAIPEGHTVKPMNWWNANFTALMTLGESHLRSEIGYANPTGTRLNLGDFDWTVEFWFLPTGMTGEEGMIFEIGTGPRGENQLMTMLSINREMTGFTMINARNDMAIASSMEALNPETPSWNHFAFVYDSKKNKLSHFVNGQLISSPVRAKFKGLDRGDEAYMSVGRSGTWDRPMQGRLDELRFSEGQVYLSDFKPPASFATIRSKIELVRGPELLFDGSGDENLPVRLGGRKHLFIDDSFVAEAGDIEFVINPPRKAERVIDSIVGEFRKHLTVVEGDDGIIRIYNSGPKDYLQVFVSDDGINFEAPDVGFGEIEGKRNIIIADNVGGLGNPFVDPNGPDEERWKYFTDYNRRGIYLYTSPDGYNWKLHTPGIIPFRSGTQSCMFYDDQKQEYVGYHRSGIFHTPAGATSRSSVVVRHKDLFMPVEYTPLSQEDYLKLNEEYPLRDPLPWWVDNGPLTPGGFGMEFPHSFDPIPADPVGTDFYITKAQKYPWAPDTYLAFPIAYFHYELDGPLTRQILMDPERGLGSGPLESQLEVSRDGLNWNRYPRPAYVGVGRHEGRDVVTAYIAQGMVRRGDEIWQYYFGETQYHSAWKKDKAGRAVYRLVQRLDGFVSVDSPYDREVTMVTKPFVFEGTRLALNIDTDAVGYAQVGFLDENGNPIPGFSVDDCIYINGDFIAAEAEWIKNKDGFVHVIGGSDAEMSAAVKNVISSKDVSELEGRTVSLEFRMRGAKLYAMQFVEK